MVSNMFYVHPYLGKIPILTNMFQGGWNHQLEKTSSSLGSFQFPMFWHRGCSKKGWTTFATLPFLVYPSTFVFANKRYIYIENYICIFTFTYIYIHVYIHLYLYIYLYVSVSPEFYMYHITMIRHITYDGRDGRFPEELNCLMKQM